MVRSEENPPRYLGGYERRVHGKVGERGNLGTSNSPPSPAFPPTGGDWINGGSVRIYPAAPKVAPQDFFEFTNP